MSILNSKIPFNFRLLVYTIMLTLMATVSPVLAQISDAQRVKEREAKKACLAGKNSYEQGIEILAELFAATNEPTYIYNQGRCYQQNNQPELALSRFQEYLRREPKMTPKENATLEIYMRECETLVAKNQPPSTVAAPLEPVPTQTLISPTPENTTRSGRGLRIAGVTMATIGFVTLGAAGTLHWLQYKQENAFQEGEVWTQQKQSRSDFYNQLALIGYGTGAAIVTTGIIFYIIGWRSGKTEEPNLALLPFIYPGEMTLSLRGAF